MSYEILLATFATKVPTVGTSGTDARRPYFNMKNFKMSDPTLSYISVEDSNDGFNYYNSSAPPNANTQQTPTVALDFGGTNGTVGTHESLTDYPGSVIRDANGNQFVVMFPAKYSTTLRLAEEVDSRTALLIFPVGVAQPDGSTLWPSFDPAQTFSYVTLHNGSLSTSVPYGPQRAPCFTPGTMIETDRGLRAVESLSVGDLVLTRDHGFRPLRWIGSKRISPERLDLQPNLRPIRIAAGALGRGSPDRDLVVSPQHRVLVRSVIAERMFGVEEVLVAAKHLLELEGVSLAGADQEVIYLHLLFDDHQILRSNGAWTELLFVGPEALNALSAAARREITALFPELRSGSRQAPSRRLLTGKEGRQLAFRHMKNRRAMAPVA